MKITSIDMNLSSPEQGIATRYLVLDFAPNLNWQKVFNQLHKNSTDAGKREVQVAGNNVIVNCCMDELQHQIDSLNELCRQTDAQILAAHEEALQKEQERVRQIEEKRRLAKEEFGKLKF